jgi:Lipocalin-like domain
MRKIFVASMAIALFLVFNACKKSDNNNSNARTVQNLSGSYTITALSGNVLGTTVNLYDSLPACDKDNLITLNSNMTAAFVDAGTKCAPPSDSTGTWSLSANTDSLYLASTAAFIKSWDGKTLVLTNSQTVSGIPLPITVTTTLAKQ